MRREGLRFILTAMAQRSLLKSALACALFATLGIAASARADIISMSDRRTPEERAEASRLRREAREKDQRDSKAAEDKLEAERVAALQVEFDADERKRESREAENYRRRMLEYGSAAAMLGVIGAIGFYKAKK